MKRKIYREDIINAGQDIMFSQGYNATGIKDITDRIDIPKGSFYNHFSSKEEFGLTVLKAYSDYGVKMHNDWFSDSTKTPIDRLESFYTLSIKKYREEMDSKLGCMMSNFATEMADINENFQKVLDEGFKDQEAAIIKCIEEGQELGEIKADINAADMGSFIINSWHGALVRMKAVSNTEPLEIFKAQILRQLIR